MSPSEHHELCERVASLEARREAEADERATRREYLDGELTKIFNALNEFKDWVRVQFFGNGVKDGCFDERLKRVERFVDAFDWKKAALSRIIAYAIQGILLVFLLKWLKLA